MVTEPGGGLAVVTEPGGGLAVVTEPRGGLAVVTEPGDGGPVPGARLQRWQEEAALTGSGEGERGRGAGRCYFRSPHPLSVSKNRWWIPGKRFRGVTDCLKACQEQIEAALAESLKQASQSQQELSAKAAAYGGSQPTSTPTDVTDVNL
ncbi:hypothetical protein BTVI_01768 [Pitangus sulphuratus]|nr:hypothetical protein BTVI_01768 [Pitangus sulphuratus]